MRLFKNNNICISALVAGAAIMSCNVTDPQEKQTATVRIVNGFPTTTPPPWTIADCSYNGVEFGKIVRGDTSAPMEVPAGYDYLLMVCAWDDTACSTQNCLPIATRAREEVVEGQTRIITVTMENHQGPCPPNPAVQPLSQELYDRILQIWPEYGFKPYVDRAQNPQCQ